MSTFPEAPPGSRPAQEPPEVDDTPHASRGDAGWARSLTYWDYLGLDRLLALQGGRGDERPSPDELHFIVVHQAFELWFKLVISELRLARDRLAEPEVPEPHIPYVVHHLRRINTIFELIVGQFRVMETLTPQDFLAFRDKLVPASGFQSFQMRILETLMGLDPRERAQRGMGDPLAAIRALADTSPSARLAWEQLAQALGEQSLRGALHAWLYRTPIRGSRPDDDGDDAVVLAFLEEYVAAMGRWAEGQARVHAALGAAEARAAAARIEAAQQSAHTFLLAEDTPEPERARRRRVRAGALFVESYRELPLLAWPRALMDAVVELDEQLVLFRSRHARMVERVIGRRMGTGGSSGVEYLDRTVHLRVFPDLWAIRSMLLPRDAVPALAHPEQYAFTGAP